MTCSLSLSITRGARGTRTHTHPRIVLQARHLPCLFHWADSCRRRVVGSLREHVNQRRMLDRRESFYCYRDQDYENGIFPFPQFRLPSFERDEFTFSLSKLHLACCPPPPPRQRSRCSTPDKQMDDNFVHPRLHAERTRLLPEWPGNIQQLILVPG